MKTRIVVALMLFLTVLICGSTANAATAENDSTATTSLMKAKALLLRLDVINAADQSKLTKAEKRILRREVRYIKGNLKELRGGRYMPAILTVLLVLLPVSVFQLTE